MLRLQNLVAHGTVAQVKFRYLPEPAQLALIQFNAIDGDKWPEGAGSGYLPLELLDACIKNYGDTVWTYGHVPSEKIREAVIADPDIDYDNWADYHRSYCAGGGIPDYNALAPKWPLILSHDDSETIRDGWHRFHLYCLQGADMIPVIY